MYSVCLCVSTWGHACTYVHGSTVHVYMCCVCCHDNSAILSLSPTSFVFSQLSRALVRDSEDGSLSPADYRVSKR